MIKFACENCGTIDDLTDDTPDTEVVVEEIGDFLQATFKCPNSACDAESRLYRPVRQAGDYLMKQAEDRVQNSGERDE